MATTPFTIDLTNQQLPADYKQRKLATMFISNSRGAGIQPFPYWYHNVVPTARGFKSVAYEALETMPIVDEDTTQWTYPRYGVIPTADLYTIPIFVINNTVYTYEFTTNQWREDFALGTSAIDVTTAFVSGNSYLFHPALGLYKLNINDWEAVTLDWGEGVPVPPWTDFVGITSNTGYLVFYTQDTVVYSAPSNPENFALIDSGGVTTGAGSTRIQALRGNIVLTSPIAGGAIIYSNKNMVSMRYTNNALNPWAFNEIPDGAGITSVRHVAVSPAGSTHFVWTTHGLTQVNLTTTGRVLAEWTQLLSSEQYNIDVDGEITTITGPTSIGVQIAAGGLLFISIGSEGEKYSAAWVYDIDLNRWGRMEKEHWAITAFVPLDTATQVNYVDALTEDWSYAQLQGRPLRSMVGSVANTAPVTRELAVIGYDGKRYKSDFSGISDGADSYVLVGDLRLTRRRAVTVQTVTVQSPDDGLGITVIPYKQADVEFTRSTYHTDQYHERASANWHTLKLHGDFIISEVELTLQDAGNIL